jgi:hypothetical protein
VGRDLPPTHSPRELDPPAISASVRSSWQELLASLDETDTPPLILEVREVPPAAALALVLGSRQEWGVEHHRPAVRQRADLQGCDRLDRATRAGGRALSESTVSAPLPPLSMNPNMTSTPDPASWKRTEAVVGSVAVPAPRSGPVTLKQVTGPEKLRPPIAGTPNVNDAVPPGSWPEYRCER